MLNFQKLKKVWKKLSINGSVKNYSKVDLWVLETDTSGKPIARILSPGFKTPKGIDCDAFKRVDGKSIQGHKYWWKFYDFSTVEVFSNEKGLKVSVISKSAVPENHFNDMKPKYIQKRWGDPLTLILDVEKNKKGKIESFYISGYGWLKFDRAFEMVCHHKIDNARPVFPKNRKPYIRSKRDKSIINNFSKKAKS